MIVIGIELWWPENLGAEEIVNGKKTPSTDPRQFAGVNSSTTYINYLVIRKLTISSA